MEIMLPDSNIQVRMVGCLKLKFMGKMSSQVEQELF